MEKERNGSYPNCIWKFPQETQKKKNRKRKTQDDNVANKWKFKFTSLVPVRQCNVKEESSWKLYQQTKAEIPKTEIDMLLKPKNEERIDIECNHQTFFSFLFAVVVENKRNKIERYSTVYFLSTVNDVLRHYTEF